MLNTIVGILMILAAGYVAMKVINELWIAVKYNMGNVLMGIIAIGAVGGLMTHAGYFDDKSPIITASTSAFQTPSSTEYASGSAEQKWVVGNYAFTPTVNLRGVHPLTYTVLKNIKLSVYDKFCNSAYTPTITSANDGRHRVGSTHYDGLGIDIRTKDLRSCGQSVRTIGKAIQSNIWQFGFEVITEDIGSNNEHIHIEYDIEIARKVSKQAVILASDKHGIDKDLIKSIIHTESRNGKHIISNKGAIGFMQLMEPTAKEMGVKNPWDIKQNILGGTEYIKQMLNKYNGNTEKALAAYNWGPGNMSKVHNEKSWKSKLPQETKNYVHEITNLL